MFAVIEKSDNNVSCTLHTELDQAVSDAVNRAVANTSDTEEEARKHIDQLDYHQEGDWGVWVVTALTPVDPKNKLPGAGD